jgi:hypothetical protein
MRPPLGWTVPWDLLPTSICPLLRVTGPFFSPSPPPVSPSPFPKQRYCRALIPQSRLTASTILSRSDFHWCFSWLEFISRVVEPGTNLLKIVVKN